MRENLIHGGDWAGFADAHGRLPLDFSASISPLGVPPGVQAALRDAAAQADSAWAEWGLAWHRRSRRQTRHASLQSCPVSAAAAIQRRAAMRDGR